MSSEDSISNRRELLQAIGVGTFVGLSGCAGGSGGGSGSEGDGGGEDVNLEDRYPEFDPANPEWPQRVPTLEEEVFHWGSVENIDNMEQRDEVRYGQAPMTPDDVSAEEKIDPDTLIFSRGPVDAQPEAYQDVLDPLLSRIEEETGKTVDFYEMSDHAAGVEAMRSNRLHITNAGTGIVPHYVNLANGYPFAMGVGEEKFGYKLWVLTRTPDHEQGEGLMEVSDMEGEEIVHTHENSNSGHLAPQALFTDNFDIAPGEDYEITFSGGHVESARGIDVGDYIGGPVSSHQSVSAPNNIDDMDPAKLEVLWSSRPFPSGPTIIDPRLSDEIISGLETAFMESDFAGTKMADQFGFAQFVELDYATHWDIILTIQQYNEVEYGEDL